jgi:hypothetical protein
MIRTSAQRKKALLARRRRVNASLKSPVSAARDDEQRDRSPELETSPADRHPAPS